MNYTRHSMVALIYNLAVYGTLGVVIGFFEAYNSDPLHGLLAGFTAAVSGVVVEAFDPKHVARMWRLVLIGASIYLGLESLYRFAGFTGGVILAAIILIAAISVSVYIKNRSDRMNAFAQIGTFGLVVIFSFVASTVSAQTAERRPIVTASISATVSSIAQISFEATPTIIREDRRWQPSENIVEFAVHPSRVLFAVRFNHGSIDEPSVWIDPRLGTHHFFNGNGLSYLVGYLGSTRQLEVVGGYDVTSYLTIQGGYMKYSLEDREEYFEPNPGFNQGGWHGSYWRIDRYQSLEAGAAVHHNVGKLGMQGDFMWSPRVDRHWNSLQISKGTVYENDSKKLGSFEDAVTQGVHLAGTMSYRLAQIGKMSLDGSYSYTYRVIRTSYDANYNNEDFSIRQATVGLRVGF